MRVTNIRLKNFRSFVDSGSIPLTQINVLVGPNNAGKSTILRGLHQLQIGLADLCADVRVGTPESRIEVDLVEGLSTKSWSVLESDAPFQFVAQIQSPDRRGGTLSFVVTQNGRNQAGEVRLPPTEPNHFIVPFLSKRKAAGYQEDIREQHVLSIAPDVSNLAARLSRLGNSGFPFHDAYAKACLSILGFVVTAVPSQSGQRPGVYFPDGATLPIDQLGEGVPNIVHLLTSLAVSEGKLFLVEEPENDLHPQALKGLLDLIISSSVKNQFVISTHSNIVVRHLCSSSDSNLYRVRPKTATLPVESEIEQVPRDPDARLGVLAELGYALSDFDLWDGWLVLEESSAERIIRDYLIPWFFPSLSRVRTISSGGTGKVSSTFEDLNRLFLFAHLTPVYRQSCWVFVDGDEAGQQAICRLKERFPPERHDRFRQLSQPAFEYYYPEKFQDGVSSTLAISDERRRRELKLQLLNDVRAWLDSDPDRGRLALQKSAAEVIALLGEVAASLLPARVSLAPDVA